MIRLALAWAGLLLLLGIEVAATLLHAGWVAWAAAPVMVMLVSGVFMQVLQASPLARIFGLAGLFWMAVLLGLGSVDFLARQDYPVPLQTGAARGEMPAAAMPR
jgi:hypothetical protein